MAFIVFEKDIPSHPLGQYDGSNQYRSDTIIARLKSVVSVLLFYCFSYSYQQRVNIYLLLSPRSIVPLSNMRFLCEEKRTRK